MFALPSLLAVAVWFTKPPLGSQARITVNNPLGCPLRLPHQP